MDTVEQTIKVVELLNKLKVSVEYIIPCALLVIIVSGALIEYCPSVDSSFMLDFITREQHQLIKISIFVSSVAFFIYALFIGFHFYRKQLSLNLVGKRREKFRQQKEVNEREEMESAIQAKLAGLSSGEKDLLVLCLVFDRRTIVTAVHHPYVAALRNKGLIESPIGLISEHNAPYTIPVYVWEYLKQHQTSFMQSSEVGDLSPIQQEELWSRLTSYSILRNRHSLGNH